MDELKKYMSMFKKLWNKWGKLFLFSAKPFMWLVLIYIVRSSILTNNDMLETLIYAFSLVGFVYSFVSLIVFIVSITPFFNKNYKEKTEFSLFSIIYTLIFVYIVIEFRKFLHLINYNEIIKVIKDGEILNLFSLMAADLLIAAFFLLFYLLHCWIIIKRFRILLIEKFIRSTLIAVTAFLLIATNIDTISTNCNEISMLFKVFYIIVSSATTLLYPFFDIFEFTYKQLNEIENEYAEERKKNESNGSKNYTAW